jgi:hypothetical protein
MPTTRRRHAVTETPPVQEALDELRAELGSDKVPMGELVVLGARTKLAALRAEREDVLMRRGRLADRVRNRELLGDPEVGKKAKLMW